MNRLNIITLGVKDIKKSFQFYSGLGFETKLKVDDKLDIVFFNNQGTKLALYPYDALAMDISDSDPPKKNKGFNGMTIAYNTKSKEEVNEVLKKAAALGGKIIKPAGHVFWGGYSGYFEDLDGYLFEVAYGENWEFDKNDMLVL